MSFTCADKETLVTYVYGECDPATRSLVETHLATCANCADEVSAFGAVRTTLIEWTPPERAGSFRLVREEAEVTEAKVLRPSRWWQSPLPVWARAAAAVLVVAGGAALANLEVRYDKDGFVVRTGWQHQAVVAQQTVPGDAHVVAAAQRPSSSPEAWRSELASLERQLREEIRQASAASRANPGATPAPVNASIYNERQAMAQVRAIVDESAQRQQDEMATRIAQIAGGFQLPQRGGVMRVQQYGPSDLPRARPTAWPDNLFGVSLKK